MNWSFFRSSYATSSSSTYGRLELGSNTIIYLENSQWQAFVDTALFQVEDCTGFAAVFEDPEGNFLHAIYGESK